MAKTNQKAVIGKTNELAPAANSAVNQAARQTVGGLLQAMLDKENLRKRFEELLGNRMPQFMSSIVSMVNEDENLREAFFNAPLTVLQSAMRAAAYNLPIDKQLGFAYVVPFNVKKKDAKGVEYWTKEATFVIGYRGMIQLANRAGAYERLNVCDVRQGELKSFDRLTEDVQVEWIEDEEQRESLPVVGYLGYFRLVNGYEKKIYMSVNQIRAHELKHRKGRKDKGLPRIWAENFDGMACKTVLRRLIGKWGLMSIDYQRADAQTLQFAQDIASGNLDAEDAPDTIDMPQAIPEQTVAELPAEPVAVAQEEYAEAPLDLTEQF